MNTPPRVRSSRGEIPPAPRHGARFDSPPPTSRKASSSMSSSYSTATLSPPPSSPLGPDAACSPPRKHRKRRAAALDEPPENPVELQSEGWKELEKMFGKDFGRKPTVVNPGFGLPTPSKTPARKRKHLSIEAVGGSARRLFGSESFKPAPPPAPPAPAPAVATTSTGRKGLFGAMPAKPRKGASGRLGLMAEDEDDGASISIFTDNNARIPKFDPSPENPFISRPGDAKKKRQEMKAKGPVNADTLGDDGSREDGMVYIFRGKKMFRKFTDMDEADEPLPMKLPKQLPRPLPAFFDEEEEEEEEEEEVEVEEDDEDEWEETDEEDFDEEEEDEEINAILNRRSTIRPRLLFPSKEVAEESSSEDEEAETDIEEEEAHAEEIPAVAVVVKKKTIDRSAISRLTPDSDDDDFQSDRSGRRRVTFKDDVDDLFGPGTIPKTARKKSIFDGKKAFTFEKKTSIFDDDNKKDCVFDEELGASVEGVGALKEKRKRARGGSFDAPGLHTPRKEKKSRGAIGGLV